MLLFDPNTKKLASLEQRPIESRESDIQTAIRRHPNVFFKEMGESLMLIAEEVQPAELLGDRIDLLAIDPEGRVVVIELKRGKNKRQLLQALSYTGMISKWPEEEILGLLASQEDISKDEAAERLDEFLESGAAEDGQLNQSQRIILIAEDFDPAVLFAAEWLYEQHDVDVRCYRIELSIQGTDQYLNCTCIFPPPEVTRIRRPGAKPMVRTHWKDWDEALDRINNKAIVAFFHSELANNRKNNLGLRRLAFTIAGRRRFYVTAKREFARVYQFGRFENDEEFWRGRISKPETVGAIYYGRNLRFRLHTESDVKQFKQALANDIPKAQFTESDDDGDEPE